MLLYVLETITYRPGFKILSLSNFDKIGLQAQTKGQLISKCPFVFKSAKKNNEIFVRISALASKKRSNQKSSLRGSK